MCFVVIQNNTNLKLMITRL